MRCFSCISNRKRLAFEDKGLVRNISDCSEPRRISMCLDDNHKVLGKLSSKDASSFSYRELAGATKNFKESNLIGEGGFGKVYKGRLQDGQVVAIKRLNLDGFQGNQEFIVEVLMLSLLHHPNLVKLIGYCAEGEQRLLVYEYMPLGNLAQHLFNKDNYRTPMDWTTRIKIAAGAARGLEHLHCEAKPPVIYRDLKSANILLDKDFNPKLSDFGLAKAGPVGDKTHVSTRVMGTYGYCAPDYAMSGKLNMKSDIFSFGVVLLEIITGRRAFDVTKERGQRTLVSACIPYLKDRKKYIELVDPRLKGQFLARSARHLIALTSMCLQEEAAQRPHISEVVKALNFMAEECQNRSRTSSAAASQVSTSSS